MFFILKFTFYFGLSFFILCMPLNKKPLFNYLYRLSSPYTETVLSKVEVVTSKIYGQTKKVGSQLFSNSSPGEQDYSYDESDQVKIKQSSTVKNKSNHKEHDESYTPEERELLLKILKEAQ